VMTLIFLGAVMRRREFLYGIAVSMTAWPYAG
jgi:hypothetical protein